jgi:hypothetical protein
MARLVTILGFVCAFAAANMHAATFTVTTAADSGAGSLRQAILDADANGSGVTDVIELDVPGAGPHLINLASPLPAATTPLLIDGYTQTGASANTLGLTGGINAVIRISVHGQDAMPCFQFDPGASSSTIRGINVQHCTSAIVIDGASGVNVYGNFIGTDATGTIAQPNGIGVFITGTANAVSVGEPSPAERNLISSNQVGVFLGPATTGSAIDGNYIGTDITGMSALGSGTVGVAAEGNGHFIRSNLISGHTTGANASGVLLSNNATDFDVSVNRIGTQRTGVGSIPNRYGILLQPGPGTPVPIGIGYGDSSTANVIANSLADGVALRGGAPPALQIQILYNTYRNNTELAIDLNDDGPTANDPLDADTGPNALQNYPLLTSAVRSPGGAVQVNGTLHSEADEPYRIQLYFAASCGPSGAAEGAFIEETDVTTDALGNAAFSFSVPSLPANGRVSVLAQNVDTLNTSELSECFAVVQESAQLTIDDQTVAEGDAGTSLATFTVTLTPASDLPVTVTATAVPGSATTPSDFTAAPQLLTFLPGQTTRTFSVTINGDTEAEGNETFAVVLSGAGNAAIADGEGTGTITDDEDAPAADPVAVPLLDNAGLAAIALLLAAVALRRL